MPGYKLSVYGYSFTCFLYRSIIFSTFILSILGSIYQETLWIADSTLSKHSYYYSPLKFDIPTASPSFEVIMKADKLHKYMDFMMNVYENTDQLMSGDTAARSLITLL
jgi:hypothetical protein